MYHGKPNQVTISVFEIHKTKPMTKRLAQYKPNLDNDPQFKGNHIFKRSLTVATTFAVEEAITNKTITKPAPIKLSSLSATLKKGLYSRTQQDNPD